MDTLILPHHGPAPANLLLPDLVDEVLELRTRPADVEDDRETYRAIAQQALGELHTLTVLARRQNDTIIRLHEMLRDQRAAVAEQDQVAADLAAAIAVAIGGGG